MILSGVPPEDALRYFLDEDVVVDSLTLTQWAKVWQKSRLVLAALVGLQGGDWATLSPQQRIQLALDKTYNEMAYLLYTRNYAAESNPNVKQKMDTCRTSLEAKLAGTAGKLNSLEEFFADLKSGKLKLNTPVAAKPN